MKEEFPNHTRSSTAPSRLGSESGVTGPRASPRRVQHRRAPRIAGRAATVTARRRRVTPARVGAFRPTLRVGPAREVAPCANLESLIRGHPAGAPPPHAIATDGGIGPVFYATSAAKWFTLCSGADHWREDRG